MGRWMGGTLCVSRSNAIVNAFLFSAGFSWLTHIKTLFWSDIVLITTFIEKWTSSSQNHNSEKCHTHFTRLLITSEVHQGLTLFNLLSNHTEHAPYTVGSFLTIIRFRQKKNAAN